MLFKLLRSALLFLSFSLSFQMTGQVHNAQNDKHIKVALRMVGHQILLNSGDSTSRILPVTQDENHFKIEFSSHFEFVPTELAETVNKIVKDANVAKNYIVEMISCDSNDVVYSYEVGQVKQSDIIPCGKRDQPKACYQLLFTLLDKYPGPIEEKPTSKTSNNSFIFYIIGALGLILALSIYNKNKRKNKAPENPNMIQLGIFQFDKLNSLLLLKEQKIELTGKEAELLLLLYQDVNKTVEKEVLLNTVWGDEGDYVGRTLDVFISKLRKKLEFDPKIKIVNIRGVGYKLVMEEV